MATNSPIRPTDDDARRLARALLDAAEYAALGVISPETGAPMVTRIALATTATGAPVSLISDLSAHATALKADPRASLLIGEPGDKGDPLTHPRLTLQCHARMVRHGEAGHAEISAHYLAQRPKARLYAGFADFFHVLFDVETAFLNGGFGKAFHLSPADLGLV